MKVLLKSVCNWKATLALLFAWGEVWCGVAPSWANGERLDYDIRYGFVTAGEASLITRAGPDSLSMQFLTLAQNNGFFESVYPVKDTIRTVVRRGTYLPLSFKKITNEGGFHSRSLILFDRLAGRALVSDSVLTEKGRIKYKFDTTVSLGADFHCIISAFYKVRSMPLLPGTDLHLSAISGKKKYKMRVIVHGRETVTVSAGTFKCLVVEPVIEGDGLFQAKGSLRSWLTDDYLRLPVLMKSKISVGSIRAELRSWSQAALVLPP